VITQTRCAQIIHSGVELLARSMPATGAHIGGYRVPRDVGLSPSVRSARSDKDRRGSRDQASVVAATTTR
jgi:hypothetical protein